MAAGSVTKLGVGEAGEYVAIKNLYPKITQATTVISATKDTTIIKNALTTLAFDLDFANSATPRLASMSSSERVTKELMDLVSANKFYMKAKLSAKSATDIPPMPLAEAPSYVQGFVKDMEKLEWKKAKDNFTVKTYKNNEGVLPQNITYMEWYIFENESGVLPGSQRLITDGLGNIYYTVTHYNEALLANFIKLQ